MLEELEIMLPKASDSESEDESVGDSDDMEDGEADPKGGKTSVKKKTMPTKGKKGKNIKNVHGSTHNVIGGSA